MARTTAGQIIKRGERKWVVRIFMGRDEQGKRNYLNKTIKANKKDAQEYLTRTLAAITAGTFVLPSKPLLTSTSTSGLNRRQKDASLSALIVITVGC